MPFLLPAVSAALCDVGILYFGVVLRRITADSNGEVANRLVYHYGSMLIAAGVRLFLLMIPLPYHSYRGTALKCSTLYQIFYLCTLAFVFIHILSLSMIDPRSLSSMLPSMGPLDAHAEITRHIWLMLIFSVASNCCHIVLFLHVRSTAPANAELVQGRPRVLFYYVKEKGETERDMLLPDQNQHPRSERRFSEDSNSSMRRILTNRMFLDVQARLKKAKDEWSKLLADYGRRSTSNSGSQDIIQRPLTAFRVVLQLFAYEDVLSNGRLDTVYERDNGAALMNFVPQLLSFLLHGAYESSTDLEDWILDKCRKNIYFAHRCYWFLRAWSLESQKTSKGVPARLSRASSLASFDDADTAGSPSEENSSKQTSGLLPEERAVIETLLRQVMECGEEPARRLYFGNGMESDDNTTIDSGAASASALMLTAESGVIPRNPETGMPSAKHWECISASRKFGFLPLDRSFTMRRESSGISDYEKAYFDATPVFLDALLTMAEGLHRVSKENRGAEFCRQLQLLEVQALPNNAVYVPIQDAAHRVWRIVADESIAISTKERVPCIICLEVVALKDRDVRLLLERVAPSGHPLTFPDMAVSQNERELVRAWRNGPRDPHRRDTAFEKLASQMREGMKKIPLDQMKTTFNAQFDKVKNTNIQELWTLSMPSTFEQEEIFESDSFHTAQAAESEDIERGESINEPDWTPSEGPTQDSFAGENDSLDSSSTGKMAPMGQWSSPVKTSQSREQEVLEIDDLLVPPRARHVSYQQMNTVPTKEKTMHPFNGCIPKQQGCNGKPGSTNKKPPTGAKPPPVVFKENWKEKEERIRHSSAFGSDPGWRLLPILVKANDDLRQEQLASQIIYRMSIILARERVPVWLCPYEILALTESGGIIEAIPDTISISSLKKNDPNYSSMKGFFNSFFSNKDDLADAKANFCESLAGYSMVCFLLQMKDRHNGNILLDNRGHLIHIDFGFFFLSSPGKNTGFESAPFKLTREMVEVMDGPDSRLFRVFRMLCYRAFIALRRHCMEIILLVEMLKKGNEDLPCFRGRPDDAIRELRQRFRLDLNDRACLEYVNALVDESLENWRTNWYDRYQRYCVGVL